MQRLALLLIICSSLLAGCAQFPAYTGTLQQHNIQFKKLPPAKLGGQAYRMTYQIDAPIDQVWQFKAHPEARIFKTAPNIASHNVRSRNDDHMILEQSYKIAPDKQYLWRYDFDHDTRTIRYTLSNTKALNVHYNYGTIQLTAAGHKTKIEQTAFLDFPGVAIWAMNNSPIGMRGFTGQFAIWEQDMIPNLASNKQPPRQPAKEVIAATQAPSSHATFTPKGRYFALVIGNNQYQHIPSLENAVDDSKAIAKILKQDFNFKIERLKDATRSDILTALSEYRHEMQPNDHLLIYYAGHGWLDTEADEGYWLPTDAKKDNPVNWIANSTITRALKTISAKHILLIADSCYSGKLTRGLKIVDRKPNYLQRIASKKSRTVMTSGGLEPVLDAGGTDQHSVFASALLSALNEVEHAEDGAGVFADVRKKVLLNADQTPEYSNIRKAGHDGGDFIFVRH